MNLMHMTDSVFDQYASKTAIVNQQGREVTFSELNISVNKLLFILQKYGVRKGDKVLLFIPVDIELYIMMIALFKLGAVVVFIDPWAGTSYIDHALEKVTPDFLIYIPKVKLLTLFSKRLKMIRTQLTLDQLVYEYSSIDVKESYIEDVKHDATALITFTTGSSNNPKGFNRTHQFLLAQQKAHETYFNHSSDDVDLCMFPVFVLSNLASGMTSVLANVDLKKIAKVNPVELIDQICVNKVTSMTCSPALVTPLVKHCKKTGTVIGEIKNFFTGGAPINPLLFEDLENIFTNAKMQLVYGSTEAEPIALMDSKEVVELTKSKALSGHGVALGRVVDQLHYEIIAVSDEDLTSITPVGKGEVGELCLAGEFVGKSYYKDNEAFLSNKISTGGDIWHRTGDIVYEGDDKVLYMVGRKHNRILENGNYFFPLQVEPILDRIEGVARSAYAQYLEDSTAVYIELTKASIKEKTIDAVRSKLDELNHHPDFVKVIKEIPLDKRHNAKIDYNELRKQNGAAMSTLTSESHFIKRFLAYTNERFPLVAIALFVALFSANAFYFTGRLSHTSFTIHLKDFVLSTLTLFFVFFHLRLLDEFKDYADDCIAYPDRLLSRGIITLDELGKVAFSFIGIEILLTVFMGKPALILGMIVIIYSLLMFKEFFVGEWLKSSMTAYLISHQLILPIMVYYAMFAAVKNTSLFYSNPNSFILILILVSLPSTIYEIARKCWSPDKDNENADSYTRVWGVKITVAVLVLLYFTYFALGMYAIGLFHMSQVALYVLAPISLTGIISILFFLIHPTDKNSKIVEIGGSVILLGGHLAFILGNTL